MLKLERPEIEAPLIVFVVSLLTIAGAWGFQIIGHYVPCGLCLQERVPYYVGVPLALASLIAVLAGAKPIVWRTLLAATALVFAYGVYLGTYHAGAEWALWPGPADCSGTGSSTTSAQDLLSQISHIHVVSCTDAAWRFLFLSFAGWNAVISLFLTVVSVWGAFRSPAPVPLAHPAE